MDNDVQPKTTPGGKPIPGLPPYTHTIGMVLDQPFPPDPRVMREATALIEAGHTVHLLCLKRDGEPTDEIIKGIHVHRVPLEAVQAKGVAAKLWQQYQWAKNTVLPEWVNTITQWGEANRLTLLHAHDLRIAPSVMAVGEAFYLPVVADFHENFPDLMRQLKGQKSKKAGDKAYRRWFRVERDICKRAHGIITVVNEMRERLLADHPDVKNLDFRTIIGSNAVDLRQFNQDAVDDSVVAKYKDKTVLVYVGHINGPRRGLHTVVDALPQLIEKHPDIYLLLAGTTRPAYEADLRARIAAYNLENRVEFTGELPEIAFASLIAASDIGLCPLESTEQTEAGLANKMFQYHAFGIPVLSSNTAGNQRYLEETGGGLTFKAGDVNDCAHTLLQMLANKDALEAMGASGKQAVESTYNWKVAKQPLLNMVSNIRAI